MDLISAFTTPEHEVVLERLAAAIRTDRDWVVRARAYKILKRSGRRREAARARMKDRFLSMLFQ